MDILLLTLLGSWGLVFSTMGIIATKKAFYRIIFYLILVAGAVTITLIPYKVKSNTEKETAIKCLQGNNPYKMEIQYELKDSMYIPVDTIYVKIN